MNTSARKHPIAAAVVGSVVLALVAPSAAQAVELGEPQPMAHAHNDYEHDRPLLDALEHGFTSVEADIWLVDGELLVAHDSWELDDAPTLEEAYLEPLDELTSESGRYLYPGYTEPIQLLVDIKSDGPATWTALEEELGDYQHMLSSQQRWGVKERAVEVVVSGNRPTELMQDTMPRHTFYDGRRSDLGSGIDAEFMPLVSDNWNNLFTWQGVGPMPADQRQKLHAYVDQAHAEGYRVRFWATPDTPGPARDALWSELRAAGVDHINTDDLAGLEEFLAEDPAAADVAWPAWTR